MGLTNDVKKKNQDIGSDLAEDLLIALEKVASLQAM